MSFSNILVQLSSSADSWSNYSTTSTPVCENNIDLYLFYQLMVIPSVLEIFLMSLFVERVRLCLNCCRSRPDVVLPMDIFEMENRFSFACAFGMITYLVYQVVINARYVIPFSGHVGYRIFVILLSVLVYGLAYFPVFAALAMKNMLSYGLGCLHVWVFAGIGYYDTFYCSGTIGFKLQIQVVARDLPLLFCLTYLSVILPVRFVKEVLKYLDKNQIGSSEKKNITDEIKLLQESRYWRHIRKNFLPPPLPAEPKEGIKGKIYNIAMPILKPWIYYKNPEFKYSARFLSVLLVCGMLIYKITIELLIFLINYMAVILDYLVLSLNYIGWTAVAGEDPAITSARSYLYLIYYFTYSFFCVAISATCVECVLSTSILLHIMSSYRKYLLDLHKGITTHIPPRSEKSNPSTMIGTMRWAGYQVGYITWAFIIQWILLFLVFAAVATVITLIQAGYGYLIVALIERVWPIPLTTIATIVAQFLLVKFCFLQNRGEFLGIENRRWFFVTTHFFFFYNIFLGFLSCLMRIIKAMVIGGLFLGRLDHSTLPRRFQLLDPGFDAYVGFIHMENAHVHPVVLIFIKLLNFYVPPRYQVQNPEDENGELELGESCTNPKEFCRKRACIRWNLAVMLYLNPYLRQMRKQYLTSIKKRNENESKNMEKVNTIPIDNEESFEIKA